MLTAPRSELARVVMREFSARPLGGRHRVLVNLSLQRANSLLHDGHAWSRDPAARIIADTRRAVAEAERTHAGFIVHASYAFLGDLQHSGRGGDRLRSIAGAALEAEQMVLESGRRACVVRVGYLYGPEMADLVAYRRAFHLGRPYWAGPPHHLQHNIHATDAARALLHAARERPAAAVVYATDGTPASFSDLMDHFAHLVGRAHPLHLPRISRRLVHPVVHEEHQQMLDVGAVGHALPTLAAFTPLYPDHRSGLGQVIEAWSTPG